MSLTDRVHALNPRPPLHDFLYLKVPYLPFAVAACDVFATLVIFSVAGYLYFVLGDVPAFRWGLLDLAVGKVFSTTLHCFTVLPDSRTVVGGQTPVIGPLMGGATDRLMSNHVFELGVALHIAQGLGWVRTTPERVAIMALFSLGIVASRGHYTVDVVLAWWWLAVVGRLGFKRRQEVGKE